ncbi:MAG: DUF4335 domain-containing protein [Microcoleus sp. SIO2G3]|nr:DUF4335 domain-containing protein [Microcoleus sp. SIO2G3]
MPLSNSVLRRYTPPTCTLEIVAKSSPLSRWVGQSVLKDLRFELRFDDPRKPEEERVTIRGDRTDLEMLYDAVNSYVQQFLDPSPTQLPLVLRTSPTADGSMPRVDLNQDSNPHPASGVKPFSSVAAQAFEEEPDTSPSSSGLESNSKVRSLKPRTPSNIYLQPNGLLTHNLFLGHLATQESGSAINLSVLQLFDLATALDEYAAEVVALPNLNSPLGWKKAPPPWASAAAAVLLAVGVTTAGVRYLNQPSTVQEAAIPPEDQQASATPQVPLAPQVPVAPTTPLPSPSASPLQTPVLPPGLSSAPKLAPPSPVITPPPTTGNLPSTAQRQTLPILPAPQPILVPPNRPAPQIIAGAGASRSTQTPSASSSSGSRPSSGSTTAQKTTPSTSASPPLLPDLPALSPTPSANQAGGIVNPSSATRSAGGAAGNQSQAATTGNGSNNTLFDNIPQIAEARSYFQQRWQPPADLKQTLEYSLLLNADGSIQRIIPLGQAAGQYIDRTDMPLPGEPFVSALPAGGNPTIRVVLTPDGKVNTFLEK